MLKETETEETIVFSVIFLSLVEFRLGGDRPPGPPPGYAFGLCPPLEFGQKIWAETRAESG